MAKKKHHGRCSICGETGPLTFEHVPPKSAFNDKPVVVARAEQALKLGPNEPVNGQIQQRGVGGYTLCGRCNNLTGHLYGSAFADFCFQGMQKLILANGQPQLAYLFHTFPLRVIKQIVTMFFSINHSLGMNHEEMVRFVLNAEAQYLPPDLRVFLYYTLKGRLRLSGYTGMLSLGAPNNIRIVSELTFPPFGYLLSFQGGPPDKRLVEITHFARYAYNDWVDIELRLPALETHLAFPGDYRTLDEIERDRRANEVQV